MGRVQVPFIPGGFPRQWKRIGLLDELSVDVISFVTFRV